MVLAIRVMRGGSGQEISLKSLHFTIKTLHASARILGEWALQAENSYNEMVRNLH